ncbi:hypothetical protein D9M71_753370 [compost metagenome]
MLHSNCIQPINIGNPDEISLLQLAQEIIELTASPSKISHRPLPIDDPKQRKPDIGMAKAKLNWQPKIDRKLGLEKTIDFYRKVPLETLSHKDFTYYNQK